MPTYTIQHDIDTYYLIKNKLHLKSNSNIGKYKDVTSNAIQLSHDVNSAKFDLTCRLLTTFRHIQFHNIVHNKITNYSNLTRFHQMSWLNK